MVTAGCNESWRVNTWMKTQSWQNTFLLSFIGQGLDGNSLSNSVRLQTHDIFDLFSVNTSGSYSNSHDQVAIIQHPTGFLTSESGLRGFTFKLRAFIVETSARSEPAFADHVVRDFSSWAWFSCSFIWRLIQRQRFHSQSEIFHSIRPIFCLLICRLKL